MPDANAAGENETEEIAGSKQNGGTNQDGDSNQDGADATEMQPKPRTVSFNNDVHVKRIGTSRESLGPPPEPPIRKEPFTHLSERELLSEADRIREEAESLTCTTDHPPERFYSLPHKKKIKSDRRDSQEVISIPNFDTRPTRKQVGRSTSDVGSRKKSKERTSLSTLFRRANRSVSPEVKVVIPKKRVIVKRSKSDVSDLKSNSNLSSTSNSIRKRSGSESEDYLKSFKNKKTQLSPIIEITPRGNYFQNSTQPRKADNSSAGKNLNAKNVSSIKTFKVNPVEKPPRFKSPEKSKEPPKPPVRTKKAKIVGETPKVLNVKLDTEPTPQIIKPTIVIDEVDNFKTTDLSPIEVKNSIRESIDRLQNLTTFESNLHSSQLPAEKPPLTKGQTVEHIVNKFQGDIKPLSLKTSLFARDISPSNSYLPRTMNADSMLHSKSLSPDRSRTPFSSSMEKDKEVVYAQVVCGKGEEGSTKQTVHKSYSPLRFSDIDEGLGIDDSKMSNPYSPKSKFDDSKMSNSYSSKSKFDFETVKSDEKYNSFDSSKRIYDTIKSDEQFNSFDSSTRIYDSPISPSFKEFKSSFYEEIEPTYSNAYSSKIREESRNESFYKNSDFVEDRRRFSAEPESRKDYDFNELSFRRELLESRTNRASVEPRKPKAHLVSKYFDNDVEKRLKSTEKYINETANYYHETKEKDGIAESVTEKEFQKYDNGNNHVEKTFERTKVTSPEKSPPILPLYKTEREIIIPPEPEYEPPSLEVNKQVLSPNEYVEKKYHVKNLYYATSQDVVDTTKRSKSKSKSRHINSSPNIEKEIENHYENTSTKYEPKTYDRYDSLRKDKDRKAKFSRDERYIMSKDVRDHSTRYDDKESRLVDSGIENDFRKEYSGEINRYKTRHSDDEISPTSKMINSEKRHTEETYKEEFYENGDLKDQYYEHRYDDHQSPVDKNREERAIYHSKTERYDDSPSRNDSKVSSKPPKSTKKVTGLEKVKQLFSRDSSKKSKKDKEPSPSPKHRVHDSPDRRSVRNDEVSKRYMEYKGSSDEDPRRSDAEGEMRSSRYSKSKTIEYDNNMAQHYSQRRRLATPSPTPSPSREVVEEDTRGSWFKSLDRLSRKKNKASKVTQNREVKTEDEASDHQGTPIKKKSSLKNVRYFGDTEIESEPNYSKRSQMSKTTNRHDSDDYERNNLNNKSYSLSNLNYGDSKKDMSRSYHEQRTYRRNLHNISEVHSNSETESHYQRRKHRDGSRSRDHSLKPPMSPDRRSRSHSSSKVVKTSSTPLKGSRSNLREDSARNSSGEMRSSRQELRGSRSDVRSRRRGGGGNSGESSTEGESSQHSQRSVVYLHATTVGDIPDPERTRNRSRDDVSSVHSTPIQVKHVSRSFSLLAPWRPRHYGEEYDVNYAQTTKPSSKRAHKQTNVKSDDGRRSELTPSSRSYSQTTLNRRAKPMQSRLSSSSSNIYRKSRNGNGSSKENIDTLNTRMRRDRRGSFEIPIRIENGSDRESTRSQERLNKDKKVGWFKMSNKHKKSENTRVR